MAFDYLIGLPKSVARPPLQTAEAIDVWHLRVPPGRDRAIASGSPDRTTRSRDPGPVQPSDVGSGSAADGSGWIDASSLASRVVLHALSDSSRRSRMAIMIELTVPAATDGTNIVRKGITHRR